MSPVDLQHQTATSFLFVLLFLTALPSIAYADDETSIPSADDAPRLESSQRVQALVDRARADNWSPDRLFSHLKLDDFDDCLYFADRTHLRERHARWSEAVELLWKIDPDALQDWLLGRGHPPNITSAETDHQLRCLFEALVDAADTDHRQIRLFLDVGDQLDEQFHHPREAIRAADRSEYWLGRLVQALTRSGYRSLYGQASIWRRKFHFTGRAFNRISEETARRCSGTNPGLWNPGHGGHRHCWHQVLSATDREREILQASAAPGLSRHHWGTDVDILSLNPASFRPEGPLYDDWRWLEENGLDYGFFQTYGESDSNHAHMEERWHWSYYPIGQALWEFVRHNPDRFEELLFEQWDHFETRWNPSYGPYFEYLRDHWHGYLFEIQVPSVDAESSGNPPHPGFDTTGP